MRQALDTKYANLEWLTTEREVDVPALFVRAEAALRAAGSDAGATALFNRLVTRIADGHVSIDWPRPAAAPAAATVAPPAAGPAAPAAPQTADAMCRSLGYGSPAAKGVTPALPGYIPLKDGDVLPAGTATIAGMKYGFLRIGIFQPEGSPSLCTEAVAALSIPLDRPCDDECKDRIITRAYQRLMAAMDDRLTRLRAAGAQLLVVDIAGNGGGSEWTEAAARMLSRRPLQSARIGFVRGAHWAGTWTRTRDKLREALPTASPEDRRRLTAWIAQAEAARVEAERTCPPADGACPRLARAGYATGLVGNVPAGAFAGKDWAPWVFIASQFPYRDGAWDGPVVVLTDQETWSAAEQFAAILQDNRAAIILGARTGGSGCGHTWGGTPTRLTNSGATLNVPDCVRFRADGSNEVRGIIPDQLIPWRVNDGRAFRARLLEAALPEAARRAQALYQARAGN
jgi:hypothetical protein